MFSWMSCRGLPGCRALGSAMAKSLRTLSDFIPNETKRPQSIQQLASWSLGSQQAQENMPRPCTARRGLLAVKNSRE